MPHTGSIVVFAFAVGASDPCPDFALELQQDCPASVARRVARGAADVTGPQHEPAVAGCAGAWVFG